MVLIFERKGTFNQLSTSFQKTPVLPNSLQVITDNENQYPYLSYLYQISLKCRYDLIHETLNEIYICPKHFKSTLTCKSIFFVLYLIVSSKPILTTLLNSLMLRLETQMNVVPSPFKNLLTFREYFLKTWLDLLKIQYLQGRHPNAKLLMSTALFIPWSLVIVPRPLNALHNLIFLLRSNMQKLNIS